LVSKLTTVDELAEELRYLRGALDAVCEAVITLSNQAYAQTLMGEELARGVEEKQFARRSGDSVLEQIVEVIVRRLFVQEPAARKFDAESLRKQVREKIRLTAAEYLAGLVVPEEPLEVDKWGLRVRHLSRGIYGRVLAFEGEMVLVDWDKAPEDRERCFLFEVELLSDGDG
jgi:hypothetical protein